MYEIGEFYQRAEKEAQDRRKEILIECGVYDKKYSATKSDEYPFYDEASKRYYRKVAAAVSDEDYANILRYYNEYRCSGFSKYGKMMTAMSWVMLVFSVLCLIVGIAAFFIDGHRPLYLIIGVSLLIDGLALFALFNTISEISRKMPQPK